VHTYHGERAAVAAEEHFDRLFRRRESPEVIPTVEVSLSAAGLRFTPETGVWLPALIAAAGLASSNSEAVRLITQGAITADGERQSDRNGYVPGSPGREVVLQRGKRQFARVRFVG
jgi:tyrosyl-tRNA synthetase